MTGLAVGVSGGWPLRICSKPSISLRRTLCLEQRFANTCEHSIGKHRKHAENKNFRDNQECETTFRLRTNRIHSPLSRRCTRPWPFNLHSTPNPIPIEKFSENPPPFLMLTSSTTSQKRRASMEDQDEPQTQPHDALATGLGPYDGKMEPKLELALANLRADDIDAIFSTETENIGGGVTGGNSSEPELGGQFASQSASPSARSPRHAAEALPAKVRASGRLAVEVEEDEGPPKHAHVQEPRVNARSRTTNLILSLSSPTMNP